ncbi:MAG: hypothetical protein HY735_15770 [Verrucomicrobia bacterium]|nr:hypothetical protein [Verrucomicrobiota bacterium]
MRPTLVPLALLTSLLVSGCASSYMTPGRPADLALFTDPQIRAAYDAEPSAKSII